MTRPSLSWQQYSHQGRLNRSIQPLSWIKEPSYPQRVLFFSQAGNMTPQEFESTLIENKHREPFRPFVVEKSDGTEIEIVHPGIAFDESGATYLSPAYDLIEFRCDEVRAIRQATSGAAS